MTGIPVALLASLCRLKGRQRLLNQQDPIFGTCYETIRCLFGLIRLRGCTLLAVLYRFVEQPRKPNQ